MDKACEADLLPGSASGWARPRYPGSGGSYLLFLLFLLRSMVETRSCSGLVPAPTTRPVTSRSAQNGGCPEPSARTACMSVTFSLAHRRKARPDATPQVTMAVRHRLIFLSSSLLLVVSGPSLELKGSMARSIACARMNRPASAPHWLS